MKLIFIKLHLTPREKKRICVYEITYVVGLNFAHPNISKPLQHQKTTKILIKCCYSQKDRYQLTTFVTQLYFIVTDKYSFSQFIHVITYTLFSNQFVLCRTLKSEFFHHRQFVILYQFNELILLQYFAPSRYNKFKFIMSILFQCC